MEEILIGRNHVSEQDMQNALRGAFLEGFKEGTTISQRSMFAVTFLDSLLDKTQGPPTEEELQGCWKNADLFAALGRPKKATNETIQNPQ